MRKPRMRALLETFGPRSETLNATGNVTSVDALLQSDALRRLDESHPALYAIAIFDGEIDEALAKYVRSDAAATDTGSEIFLLYESEPQARPRAEAGPGGVLIKDANPLVEFARALFPDAHLVSPGVVFMDSLASPSSALYVPVARVLPTGGVASYLAQVFGAATGAAKSVPDRRQFGEKLGLSLARSGIPYVRNADLSSREHVMRLLRALWGARKDLLAAVPVVGKMMMGGDKGND